MRHLERMSELNTPRKCACCQIASATYFSFKVTNGIDKSSRKPVCEAHKDAEVFP